jgi:hypothetical protein
MMAIITGLNNYVHLCTLYINVQCIKVIQKMYIHIHTPLGVYMDVYGFVYLAV